MGVISFRCASCQQVLKVGSAKAGRRAKCTKCGKELTIPQASAPAEEKKKPEAAVPADQPKSSAFGEDDDDDGAAYTFINEPAPPEEAKPQKKKKGDDDEEEDEEQEEKSKDKTEQKPRPVRRKIKKKTVQFAEDWLKFQLALMLVFGGMCCWILAWVLHAVLILLGFLANSSYGLLVDQAAQAGAGEVRVMPLMVSLLAGADYADLGNVLLIIEQVINLVGGVAFLGAFCICLGVPNRFGTRGQAITLVTLSGLNLILGVVFKFLPVLGAISYTMVPLLAPEVAMNESNIDRVSPIHVFWSGAPFWEFFLTVLIQVLYFGEPIFFCIFLRAAALSMKDDEWLEPRAFMLLRLGFGQLFILLAFYLLSITGSSAVLRVVLFAAYILWRCFFLGFIIHYARIAFQAKKRVEYLLVDEEE